MVNIYIYIYNYIMVNIQFEICRNIYLIIFWYEMVFLMCDNWNGMDIKIGRNFLRNKRKGGLPEHISSGRVPKKLLLPPRLKYKKINK